MQTCITSVNARGIELVRQIALSSGDSPMQEYLPNVPKLLWQRIDEEGIERLAQLPVLLIDMKFGDEQWWQGAASSAKDTVASTLAETVVELSRETLMVAWLSARADPRVAALVTGMSCRTSALVADLTPADVTRIAIAGAQHLRLRWQRSQSFWATLLSAASEPNYQMLHLAKLHSLQLSCDVGSSSYAVPVSKVATNDR